MSGALWLFAAPLAAANSPVNLRLNVVSNLEQSYQDHGSGATMDLLTWQPSCSPTTHAPACEETWMSLGDVATSSEGARVTAIVALAGPGDPQALAEPTSLALNWNTLLHEKSKGTSGGVYTAVCPAGYAALGSVAIKHDISKPHEITTALCPHLRCLKKTYLTPGGQLRLPLTLPSRWDGMSGTPGRRWYRKATCSCLTAMMKRTMTIWTHTIPMTPPTTSQRQTKPLANLPLLAKVSECAGMTATIGWVQNQTRSQRIPLAHQLQLLTPSRLSEMLF
jgi:hypothetical protein